MIFNRVWLSGGVLYRASDYDGWYVDFEDFTSPKYTVLLAVL